MNPPPRTIVLGDCLATLRTWPDASIDCVVTDCPYGLGDRQPKAEDLIAYLQGSTLDTGGDFLGYQWQIPSVAIWRECLRVLRPGGHLLTFGGSRTFDLISLGLRAAGFEIRDTIMCLNGQGFPKAKGQLKPSHEPILIARKRTRHAGQGRLDTEACRIQTGEAIAAHHGTKTKADASAPLLHGAGSGYQIGDAASVPKNLAGRWPANVILSEGEAVELLDEQSRERGMHPAGSARKGSSDPKVNPEAKSIFNGLRSDSGLALRHGDKGGASRFYYVAKASQSERERTGAVNCPCVKPLDLMRWLVRLAVPVGGLVLDPYCGSGTTLHAAELEGRAWIGIERDPTFHAIATARMHLVNPSLAAATDDRSEPVAPNDRSNTTKKGRSVPTDPSRSQPRDAKGRFLPRST